jgi:hypothetical protein
MAGVIGHSVHLCLAPFVGVSAAQELIAKAGAPPVAV